MNGPLKKIKLLIVGLFAASLLYAQSGKIRGTVIEDATGEPLFSVTVVIAGTTNGAITDFDGKFEITADPGTYDLQVSFVSFKTLTITDLEVTDGGITLIDQIRLQEDVVGLEEIVISGEVIKNTEAALLTVKKKSANLLDGISSASFRKIGDSEAASAAKRITGVSIEGGRYVYVRGLGDRYTKTLINQMDVPGLDPDRNTLQMDIFPTNVLNNIVVSKSFTADLPADFTGGMVNIETKDFPELRNMNISFGLGYNSAMHFNTNFPTYDGGSTDFLGFDDGTRELPFSDADITHSSTGGIIDPRTLDPNAPEGIKYADQLRSFTSDLSAMRTTSFMDYNAGFSTGDQINIRGNTLGYNLALTYSNSTEFYEGAEYGRFGLSSDKSIKTLERREFQKGDYGVNSALIGGLAGIAFKTQNAKYKLNYLHLQNGEKKTGIFDFVGSDEGSDFNSFQHNLEFSQRRLSNVFLGGEHFINNGAWKVDWKISPTKSSLYDPDIKFTRYEVRNEGDLSITTEGGFPERIWRNLDEINLSSTLGLTREYEFNDSPAKLKFGAGNTFKNRKYIIRRFQFFVDPAIGLTGNPDEIVAEENIWPQNGNRFDGNYFIPDFLPVNPNFYESSIRNMAFYISNEFSPVENLRAIVGVRSEDYKQNYTGTNQQGFSSNDSTVIDEFNFFPSANLIYAVSENQNIRFSYSRTIARFSFKEASFAEIFDPLTGRTFIGALNPGYNVLGEVIWDGNIKSTLIDNFDLRWEVFQLGGQTVSVSGFYKKFNDAIEMVQSATADNNFQPRNVGNATVIGGEVEFRQNLGQLTTSLEKFTLNGNLTLLKSEIEMSQEEFDSRVRNAREGQHVRKTRELQGQAPYIINGGIAYDGNGDNIEAGLYYNVQGETLVFTGIADRPDIYSVPFHSINFTLNKTFGARKNIRFGFKATNILGDKREQIYRSFGSGSGNFFQSLNPGTKVSFSLRYSIL